MRFGGVWFEEPPTPDTKKKPIKQLRAIPRKYPTLKGLGKSHDSFRQSDLPRLGSSLGTYLATGVYPRYPVLLYSVVNLFQWWVGGCKQNSQTRNNLMIKVSRTLESKNWACANLLFSSSPWSVFFKNFTSFIYLQLHSKPGICVQFSILNCGANLLPMRWVEVHVSLLQRLSLLLISPLFPT